MRLIARLLIVGIRTFFKKKNGVASTLVGIRGKHMHIFSLLCMSNQFFFFFSSLKIIWSGGFIRNGQEKNGTGLKMG